MARRPPAVAKDKAMALPGIIRRLTYNPWVIRTIRALGLRPAGRKVYHYLVLSRKGVLRVERRNTSASFITRTPEQLRAVEAVSLEPSLDLFVRSLKPGDAVYDIGSNVGVYAVLLAQVVGEKGVVVAFEPHPATYEHLLGNIRLNGLTNIRAFRKALGERDSQEKLYIGDVIANLSLLAGAIEGTPDKEGIPFQLVEVVQGDPFVQVQGLPIPRAVKIVVVGVEYAVIRGLQQTLADPGCRMVCCEVHPQFLPSEVKPDDIRRFLASLGYDRMEGPPSKTPYHLVAYKS